MKKQIRAYGDFEKKKRIRSNPRIGQQETRNKKLGMPVVKRFYAPIIGRCVGAKAMKKRGIFPNVTDARSPHFC